VLLRPVTDRRIILNEPHLPGRVRARAVVHLAGGVEPAGGRGGFAVAFLAAQERVGGERRSIFALSLSAHL
jgi:hypothetical protein